MTSFFFKVSFLLCIWFSIVTSSAQSFTVLLCDEGIEHLSTQGIKTKVLPGMSLASGQLLIKKEKYLALYLGNGRFWEKDTSGIIKLDHALGKNEKPKMVSEIILKNHLERLLQASNKSSDQYKVNPVYRCRCLTDLIIYGGEVNKVIKGSDLTLHWMFKSTRNTDDKTHIVVKNLFDDILEEFSTQNLEFELKYDKSFFDEEKSFLIELSIDRVKPIAYSGKEQLLVRMTTKEEEKIYFKELEDLNKEHRKKSGLLYTFLKAQICEKNEFYLDATQAYFEIYKRLQTDNEVFNKQLFEQLFFRY